MGNSHGSDHHHKHGHHQKEQKNSIDPRITKAFKEISGGSDTLHFEQFHTKFGLLSEPLWTYLNGNTPGKDSMTLETFSYYASSLMGESNNVYVKMLMPVDRLLMVCFEAAGVKETPADESFLKSFKEDMTSQGEDPEKIISWKIANCPRLLQPVHEKVLDVFFNRQKTELDYTSDLLTPVQMFILQACLPTTIYFTQKTQNVERADGRFWITLYSSLKQGISINRFEANVFHYKGPTITIFKLNDGSVNVIALDQEWKYSTSKFGGPQSIFFQFSPKFKRVDGEINPVYCNFKLKSSVFGLSFGRHFNVDGEMGNVADIEAWGCGGAETLLEQRKQKQWLQQQAMKNQKVPLPGNWDENPDKVILEMSGKNFSDERKADMMAQKQREAEERYNE